MNSSAPSGQVLGAAISVLPATGAFVLFPQIHTAAIYSMVVTLAGLWAVSYIGTSIAMRFLKK